MATSIYTDAQWEWVLDRICIDHYRVQEMAAFLGVAPTTIYMQMYHRGYQIWPNRSDLNLRRDEFNALGKGE